LDLAGCRDGDLDAGFFACLFDFPGFDVLLAILLPGHAGYAAESNKRS
jgi:hypothetical protein